MHTNERAVDLSVHLMITSVDACSPTSTSAERETDERQGSSFYADCLSLEHESSPASSAPRIHQQWMRGVRMHVLSLESHAMTGLWSVKDIM